jgi:hypothetical protein
MKNLVLILIALLALPSYGCFHIAFPQSGLVMDKSTGQPISDVIIVKSWVKEEASVAGAVGQDLEPQEVVSDEQGKFRFSTELFFYTGFPPFVWVDDLELVAYKPGYKFILTNPTTTLLEMERISDNYYLRYQEMHNARSVHFNLYSTKIFKEALSDEEIAIKALPRYVPGVLYQGFSSPRDLDIDSDNNIYVSDAGIVEAVFKLSNNGEILDKIQIYRSRSGAGPIDIDRDENGSLYLYSSGDLFKLDRNSLEARPILPKKSAGEIFPHRDMHFAIKGNKVVLINDIKPFANEPYIYIYDTEGNYICRYEPSPQDIKDWMEFIDLTFTEKGNIFVIYSYLNADRNLNKYINGVLILDQACNEMKNVRIDLDGKVTSIAHTSDAFIIADKHQLYFFDTNLQLEYKYDLIDKDLGAISIKRIKTDPDANNLYIIESNYRRILAYKLRSKALFTKDKADHQ